MAAKNKARMLADDLNDALKSDLLRMGNDKRFEVSYIPTGVLPIDKLLGGGLARGRAIEFFGDYSTLKSYVGLRAISEAQKMGLTAALVDTEHAYDPEWAESLGVDVDRLILAWPPSGEEAVDATELLIRNGAGLIVWDSVAASLPRAERDKSANENHQPARLAQMMSLAMRKLTAANSDTSLLFINQTRVNVGQMFGNPEHATGGKSLPFYASQRVALRKAGKLKKEVKGQKITTGMTVRATLEKSKLNQPHQEIKFDFLFGEGIDELGLIIRQGMEDGTIVKKKGWYTIAGTNGKNMRESDLREWLENERTGNDRPAKKKAARRRRRS